MMSAQTPGRFDELLSLYLDGSLAPAQEEELCAFLRDEVLAEVFCELTRVDGELAGLLATPIADEKMSELVLRDLTEPVAASQPPRRGCFAIRPRGLAAIAAVALVAIGLTALYRSHFHREKFRVVSGQVIVNGIGADRIAAGSRVTVPANSATAIRLDDGSMLELAPSTEAVLHGMSGNNREMVDLEEGGGRFQAAHPGVWFCVRTEVGSITADGSDFSVDLQASDDADAPKRSGRRSADAMHVAVTSGTVQVDFAGGSRRLGAGERRTFTNASQNISGTVKSVDLQKRAITLLVHRRLGGFSDRALTFSVGAKFTIDGMVRPPAELAPGMPVVVNASAESELIWLRTEMQAVGAVIRSVDRTNRTIIVETQSDHRTFSIGPDTTVIIDGKTAAISDVGLGRRGILTLSADGRKVLSLTIGISQHPATRPRAASSFPSNK